MKNAVVICFTGIDGSGKTSHAHALLKKMERDAACTYAWCRWAFGLSSLFHFIVRKTIHYTKENYSSCRPLQLVFQYLLLFDFVAMIFIKVRIPKLLGSTVIIDRYVYDALADLSFWGFDISAERFFVWLFLAMNPTPNLTFLISTPAQIASARKSDLTLVNAIEYERIYNRITRICHFHRIANLDFKPVHKEILDVVAKLQRTKH